MRGPSVLKHFKHLPASSVQVPSPKAWHAAPLDHKEETVGRSLRQSLYQVSLLALDDFLHLSLSPIVYVSAALQDSLPHSTRRTKCTTQYILFLLISFSPHFPSFELSVSC